MSTLSAYDREIIRQRRAEAARIAAQVAAGTSHAIIIRGNKRLVHAGVRLRFEVHAGGAWQCIDEISTKDRAAVQRLVCDLIDLDECTYDYLVGAGIIPDSEL